MNGNEFIREKNRRKTEQKKCPKINLDISKINKSKFKFSISPRIKIKTNNNKNNLKNSEIKNFHYSNKTVNKHKLIQKHISIQSSAFKRQSMFNPIGKNIEDKKIDDKRYSLEIFQTKTKKFYQKYNLKINGRKSLPKINNNNNNNVDFTKSQLNKIEDNIINAINNMRIKIEKQSKTPPQITNIISAEVTPNKLASSPNLKFIFKKKTKKSKKGVKKFLQSSLLMKETRLNDYSFKKNDKKKRNRSFDLSERAKKKILNKFKNSLMKSSIKGLTIVTKSISYNDEDSENNNENYKGFALLPTSNILLYFDLFLIIADLYSFIVIPLSVAKNNNIRNKNSIVQEIIQYLIDLIFLLDFILSFFRGYYNFEMEIVRNNKKIIKHYLKQYLTVDLLQAIPLYTIIRIFYKPKNIYYFGYFERESILVVFFLFIKPFKIFKIIKKKQNKALEDFYLYLSESYYLEQLVSFIIYFIIFFLFIHLFICLHIYLAFQNYPNWITHINIINESFFAKYISSFYFMITTMTTVGYGDIVCISPIERIYHIILLVIGTLLYTFLVSKIGNYLRDERHEQIKLDRDLNILENIRITYPAMSFKLYAKIKSHLLSIFNKRKKTGISLLINGVPDAIKNDLLFKIYAKVINGFSIFKDVKNSHFILQVLQSFIPVLSKKEEIIILEGEVIQNIVFVKDGRLSLEIAIDLNDPYKSFQKYFEVNFTGISKNEENNLYLNKDNSVMFKPERNYNDLKAEIDFLLENRNTLVNNSRIESNGISVDLGRLDFSRNEIEEIDYSNYQIIKIIDIRKNEHYGDVHMLIEKPSPFTLKAKSRIAELFLLRKHDATVLSNNFQNIWKRIHSKSYHNLVSIKKLTFKILKQYYNTYFYKKNKENPILSNLDVTRNSVNDLSFIKNLKRYNNKVSSKNNNIFSNSQLKSGKTLNNINKNKLFIGYEQKRKNSGDQDDELSFSSSFDSNSFDNSNNTKNTIKNNNINDTLPIIKINQVEKDKDIISFNNKIRNSKTHKIIKQTSSKAFGNKKMIDKFTFNSDNESKHFSSPKKILSIKNNFPKFKLTKTSKKSLSLNNYDYKSLNNSQNKSDNNLTHKSSINETINICNQVKDEIKNNNNNINILTLEDINQNLSKRIKKKIKKRKKIKKLKEFLKLQSQINKFFSELNKSKNNSRNDIITNGEYNLDYSISSSNNKLLSQILDSTTTEIDTNSIFQSNRKYSSYSLKIESSESFHIKSYYNNINSLTKGKMINNMQYKKYIESILKKYINESKENSKIISSSILKKNKKEKYFRKSFGQTEIKKNNDEIIFSENDIKPMSNQKFKNIIIEETNKLSSKNNIKTEKLTEKKTVSKNKNSSKIFEKEIEIKENGFKKSDIEYHKNNMETNVYKGNNEKKNINKIKKENKIKDEDIINSNSKELNNKSLKSSLNVFKEYDKYYNNTNENRLSMLNTKNNNVSIRNSDNIIEENEKTKKCKIF